VIAAALIAAAALSPSYTARTDESRRLTIAVRHGRVARVTTTVVRYECDQFGDVGPLRIRVAPARPAPVGRRGRFSFVSGTRAERVGVAGTLGPHGNVTGRLRVSGTIGTGERCASPVVRFRSG
jgi:hypothetical protein